MGQKTQLIEFSHIGFPMLRISIASLLTKWIIRSTTWALQLALSTAPNGFIFRFEKGVAANRAMRGEDDLFSLPVLNSGKDFTTCGSHRPIFRSGWYLQSKVFLFNVLFIVYRNASYRYATHLYGINLGNGCNGSGSANLEFNTLQF